jgi:hypothetical protein
VEEHANIGSNSPNLADHIAGGFLRLDCRQSLLRIMDVETRDKWRMRKIVLRNQSVYSDAAPNPKRFRKMNIKLAPAWRQAVCK